MDNNNEKNQADVTRLHKERCLKLQQEFNELLEDIRQNNTVLYEKYMKRQHITRYIINQLNDICDTI
jgi:hypothetical protein